MVPRTDSLINKLIIYGVNTGALAWSAFSHSSWCLQSHNVKTSVGTVSLVVVVGGNIESRLPF